MQDEEAPDNVIEMTQDHRSSLRDLCAILFRYKYKMLLFFIAVVGAATLLTLKATKIYQSQAKLLVRLGRESVTLDPTATTGRIVPVVTSRESEILTELEILRSRKIAERVVASVGPNVILNGDADQTSAADAKTAKPGNKIVEGVRTTLQKLIEQSGLRERLSDHDSAVLAVMTGMRIDTEKDTSNIINIHFEADTPQLAQKVVTELIDTYLEERIAIHTTPGSYEFFAQQCKLLHAQLLALEQQLQTATNGAGASSIDEQLRVAMDRIGRLESDIDRVESSIAASRAKVQKLTETLALLPETIVTSTTTGFPNVAADAMRERLYELQLKEQDLVSKYNEDSRQIQDIRRQIAEAQALLRREVPIRAQTTQTLNSARQQTHSALLAEHATLSSREAQVVTLKQKLAEAGAHLSSLNNTAAEIKRLKRDIDIQEANYRKYAENREQARIDHALDAGRISNITIVQPATLPTKPVRPRTALQLLLGLVLGLFGSLVLAFACDYLDHTIRTPREVAEKLRLPTLAYVPCVRANTVRPQGRRPRSGEPIQWDIPSGLRPHYGLLAQRIMSGVNGSKRRPRLLAVTGAHRGAGVSAVAANLAAALSHEADGPVLLVDANLPRPALHKLFKIETKVGLADVLSNGDDWADAIVALPVEHLSLLPAGHRNGDRKEPAKPAEWANLLNSLKRDYRYIVVDLPALQGEYWAGRIAGLCDAVALVVEAEKSRWEAALAAKELLLMSKAHIMGVVLNKRRFCVPRCVYDAL